MCLADLPANRNFSPTLVPALMNLVGGSAALLAYQSHKVCKYTGSLGDLSSKTMIMYVGTLLV